MGRLDPRYGGESLRLKVVAVRQPADGNAVNTVCLLGDLRGNGAVMADVHGSENARRIVSCVNHHDELVVALRNLRNLLNSEGGLNVLLDRFQRRVDVLEVSTASRLLAELEEEEDENG